MVFHVVNRAAKRAALFENEHDYRAFEEVLIAALGRVDIALYAYCVMPNHWHLVMSPMIDGALSRFMHWLTTTHARRWQIAKGLDGYGAVYQGRFRSIPVGNDSHFLWACRYVERNALRASLVSRAEDWRWSSLWQRHANSGHEWLSPWPVPTPGDWLSHVNIAQTTAEIEAFRRAMNKSEPFGEEDWRISVMNTMGRRPARPRGRPRKCPRKMTSDPIYT